MVYGNSSDLPTREIGSRASCLIFCGLRNDLFDQKSIACVKLAS